MQDIILQFKYIYMHNVKRLNQTRKYFHHGIPLVTLEIRKYVSINRLSWKN